MLKYTKPKHWNHTMLKEDPFQSAETLLPTVYDELRRIAAAKMAGERFPISDFLLMFGNED